MCQQECCEKNERIAKAYSVPGIEGGRLCVSGRLDLVASEGEGMH